MKIYLIGYMGSGKSTLGKNLANALGISWIDLDTEIESRYKISIPDFFIKYGETAFRDVEHKVLNDIALIPDMVVSTGGGVPCFHDNMKLMNQTGLTIYLEATPEIILTRIGPYAWKRPLFQQMDGTDIMEKITVHLKSREQFYQKAQIIIDATNPDLEELKKLILNNSRNISA
ncbi:MAG: shikimate kinase [Bacteroidales bacterium]|nr:shikimate kinase [Bacteroidales bacterium]